MKIALISDTHSHIEEALFKHLEDCDEVWHAGDIGSFKVTDRLAEVKPLRAVHGNIDDALIKKEFPPHQIFMCEGVKVWITHIGGYPPKYTRELKQHLAKIKPQLFICGHSHILRVISDPERGLLHMNSGAMGNHGFHQVKTMLKFQINAGKISDVNVIEFGKRGVIHN